MVELAIVSGSGSGKSCVISQFPFVVGRASSANFVIQDKGVWDEHFVLSLDSEHAIRLTARPPALVLLNGAQTSEAALRNGDRIQAGQAAIRFGLSETLPRGLRFREAAVWAGLALITAGQLALMFWLLV